MQPGSPQDVSAPREPEWSRKKPEEAEARPPPVPNNYGQTRSGPRERNEDQFVIAELRRVAEVQQSSLRWPGRGENTSQSQGWIYMVADGIGGHAAGDMASEVTVATLLKCAFTLMPWTFPPPTSGEEGLAESFRIAVKQAERNIRTISARRHLQGDPGTTLTVAYVVWPNLYVVHVGDSRCYVYRGGRLHCLTHDHNLAASGVRDLGLARNLLANAVGGRTGGAQTELRRLVLKERDVLVLCTDGFSQAIADGEIQRNLEGHTQEKSWSSESCVHELMAEAVQRASDNLTVVVAKY